MAGRVGTRPLRAPTKVHPAVTLAHLPGSEFSAAVLMKSFTILAVIALAPALRAQNAEQHSLRAFRPVRCNPSSSR